MSDLEIHKMLVLSIEHLTPETVERMEHDLRQIASGGNGDPGLPVFYDKPSWGYFVHVPEEPDMMPDNPPTDLEHCLHFAMSKGFQWIMVDVDGDVIDELPIYKR